jgi:N-methylhydantoinase A
MLVTAGFRYVLEIGRHEIPRKENLFVWRKPKRPVPPRLIMEVPERVLLDGSVERPLDERRMPRGGAAAARARRRSSGDRVSPFLCAFGA